MSRRGKTRLSEFSRPSTYSTNLPEKTSLTHIDLLRPNSDLYEQDTFVSALDQGGVVPRVSHGVRFEDSTAISDENPALKKSKNLGPVELKNRLYHRPEHNLAPKVVRNQEANRAAQNAKGHVAARQKPESLVRIH